MARAGILYSQVAKAAAQLAAEGKNPTVDNVREALGDTGSKSTIAPMLKRWKSEHHEAVAEAELGLPAELVHAVKGVYDKLQADVDQQLQEAREQHDKELQTLKEQLDAVKVESQVLKAANADLSKSLAQANDELGQSQHELHANALALTTAQTENAGLTQRLADRAAEVGSITQQLEQAHTQFEHYQETTARQRTEERQAFEQRIARLEQELATGQRQFAAQQSLLAQRDAKLTHMTEEGERLQRTLAASEDELGAACSERDRQALLIQELSTARVDVDMRLDGAQKALADARVEAATAAKQVDMLAAQLAVAEKKAEKAEQDRNELIEKLLTQQYSQSRKDDEAGLSHTKVVSKASP